MSDTPNELGLWGQQNPWEMFLPNGQPNPYFDANPKTHKGDLPPAETQQHTSVPDFGRRINTANPGGVPTPADVDPNPKKHGSLPVVIPPRTLHVA